ncbi:MAG: hypothetical protein C5B59_17785 [Bacteroidetes bacterium]|nr:MAG: hypothetical protein C5B59_17785 [Bacteroidota bacterium]
MKSVDLIIIDDDAEELFIMEGAMRSAGLFASTMGISSFKDLVNFLFSIKEPKDYPSLILADYDMPKMNGEQVFNWLQKYPNFKKIRFAMYSSFMNESLRQKLYNAGVYHTFEKPYSDADLKKLVEKIQAIVSGKESLI